TKPSLSLAPLSAPLADAAFVQKARRRLARRDAELRRLMAAVGPFTLNCAMEPFPALCRAIISQQISTKAALSIHGRLASLVADDRLTPKSILTLTEEERRSAGLSPAKSRSLCDLAAKIAGGELFLEELVQLPDEEVVARLLPVRGIGMWTAQMVLI